MPFPTSAQSRHQRTDHSESGRIAPLRHPGIVSVTVLAAFCAAYAFGHLPPLGGQSGTSVGETLAGWSSHLVGALAHISPRPDGSDAINPILYSLAGFIAFLVLLGLVRSFDLLLRRLRRQSQAATPPTKSIDEFLFDCSPEGGPESEADRRPEQEPEYRYVPGQRSGRFRANTTIGARIAREGHDLLQPYYPRSKSVDLRDDLRRDLGLNAEHLVALRLALLARCDRREPLRSGRELDSELDPAAITTVYDLLRYVENAPSVGAGSPGLPALRFDARPTNAGPGAHPTTIPHAPSPQSPCPEPRGADLAAQAAGPLDGPLYPAPTSRAPELRHPAHLEIHAVAMTPETRSRLRPHFSGLRRRSGEHRIAPEYAGPFRRATDRPRTASGERAAVTVSDPIPAAGERSQIDRSQIDALFASPRANRTPSPEQV